MLQFAYQVKPGAMLVIGNDARVIERIEHGPLDDTVRFHFENETRSLTVPETQVLVVFG